MHRFIVLAVVSVLVVACGGSGGGSTSPSPVGAASIAPTPSSAPSVSVTPSPAITPIPGCLPDCVTPNLTRPGPLSAGDYTTKYFFGGQLTVTVPAGLTSDEDSTGEFALKPEGKEDRALFFWLDVYPIVDATSKPVEGFDGTAKSLTAWIEANPNVRVIEKGTGSLGGLEATTLEFGRSSKAVNVEEGCPAEGRPCVGLLSFPKWDGFYSVGGLFHLRLVAVDATWGGETHGLYAMINADNDAAYADFGPVATKVVEGARLPFGVGQ